jgi:cytochrome P450
VALVFELITAGHETTARLIPNGLAHLLQDEARVAALRADPAGIPAFVDEALRFESSAHMALPRVATHDVRVGDQVIPRGDTVVVLLGAANRDEGRFDRPEEFDAARTPNDHLAFGFGSHFCIGHILAKAETRIATEELLTHFPTLRLDEPEGLVWDSGNMTRGVRRLTVRW